MTHILSIAIITAVLSLTPAMSYAQTASSLIANDPQTQYRNIKNSIVEAIKSSGNGLYYVDGNKNLDLYYCSDYSDMGMPIGKENNRVSQLMAVAYDAGLYEISLTSVGYPRAVWGDFVKNREQAGLAGRNIRYHNVDANNNIEKRDLERFASLLNEYRSNSGKKLPKVVVEGGCGAGGTTVSFRTSPPGGRVLLVPKMYYALCRLQGIDPDDERKCDFWREVHNGQEPEVSGDYLVKILWQDRSVIRSFSASKLQNDSNTVTLR